MLSLRLKSGEYLTIGENIAVQIFRQTGDCGERSLSEAAGGQRGCGNFGKKALLSGTPLPKGRQPWQDRRNCGRTAWH